MVNSRFCRACQTTQPVENFYSSYKTQCRQCLKAKAAPKHEQKLEYLKRWRENHPHAHKEWYAKNKAHKLKYWSEWRAANLDRCRATYKTWAKANPARINALIAKRNAAKISATPMWTDQKDILAIYQLASRLSVDTGVRHEVDHIVPLQSSLVCGLHVSWNLQVLTKTENIRKGNKLFTQQLPIPQQSTYGEVHL